MVIKQRQPLSLFLHTVESGESALFKPMTAKKKEELFHELAVINKYPDLTLGYIEANREIRTPETRSFWREENGVIHVLDKYGNLKVHEAKYYPILVKKYSTDPNMIGVSENPKGKSKFWWKTENGIMLKEGNKKTPLIFKGTRETKEEQNRTMKCEKMTPEEIKQFKNAKKSKEAQYFYEKYKPENKINLGNGKVLYTTNVLVPDYEEIIGYIMDGDCIEARMFYRSNSEGIWRACPGVREGKGEKAGKDHGLSKGEGIINYSYETTTKVVTQLGEIFDSFKSEGTKGLDPIFDTTKGKDKLGFNILMKRMVEETTVDTLFSSEELRNFVSLCIDYDIEKGYVESDKKDINEKWKKYCINCKAKGKKFNACSFLCRYEYKPEYFHYVTRESIKHIYGKIVPHGLDYQHMKKIKGKSYTYNHNYLGVVCTDVYQTNRRGKLINIYFSRAENDPNNVWIDEIQYDSAEINSFGILNKSINAAPLVGKPCDYWNQTPYDPIINSEKSIGERYADMRDIYQDNPIIKHYKKLEGLL